MLEMENAYYACSYIIFNLLKCVLNFVRPKINWFKTNASIYCGLKKIENTDTYHIYVNVQYGKVQWLFIKNDVYEERMNNIPNKLYKLHQLTFYVNVFSKKN